VTVGYTNPCATDAVAPVFSNCPASIILISNTGANVVAQWTAPTATDNCGTPTVVGSASSGASFPVGNSVVTYTATDARGNSARCTFSVMVTYANPCTTDAIAPVFSNCPANIVLASSTGAAVVAQWTAPTATDNCGTATVVGSVSSGTSFPVGNSVVTYTATDARGNSARCTFTITVTYTNPCATDLVAPVVVNCPSSISVQSTNGTTATASWTAPTATDNCTLASLTANYASGASFPVGATQVVYTALDARGNRAVCNFTVNVNYNNPCKVLTGNTITKSCVNNLPVLSGAAPSGSSTGIEYMWLGSATGCPSSTSQALAGATGASLNFNVRTTVTTYYVRCARPVGCTTWAGYESNCITVAANECAPTVPTVTAVKQCDAENIHACDGTQMNFGPYFDIEVGGVACSRNNSFFYGMSNATWTEYSNGTAKLKGRMTNTYYGASVSFDIDVLLSGYSSNGMPHFNNAGCITSAASDWRYYSTMTGTLKGVSGTRVAGSVFNLSISMPLEVGTGANSFSRGRLSVGAWTQCVLATQPNTGTHLSVGNGGTDFYLDLNNCRYSNIQGYASQRTVLTAEAYSVDRQSKIEWVSNNGSQADYFAVEKLDKQGNFVEIAVLNATTPDNDAHQYVVYDKTPEDGENYYRVKLAQNNGTIVYSEIKKVTFKDLNDFRVFPNPADDQVQLDLTQYKGKEVNITLINSFGQVVNRFHIDAVGDNTFPIELTGMGNGHYMIVVDAKGKKSVGKSLIIQK
jgi:hypothetical protein